jgi:hypothetical protein
MGTLVININMYMISNFQDDAFKNVEHQLHAWKYEILVADVSSIFIC